MSESIGGLAGRKNLVVISAAKATEFAFDVDAIRPSVSRAGDDLSRFTGALLDGLTSGEADADGNGEITAADLYEYVLGETRRGNGSAIPDVVDRDDAKHIVVARNGRRVGANELPAYLSEKLAHQEEDEREDAVSLLRQYVHWHPAKRPPAAEALSRLASDESEGVKNAAIDALRRLANSPQTAPAPAVPEPEPTPAAPPAPVDAGPSGGDGSARRRRRWQRFWPLGVILVAVVAAALWWGITALLSDRFDVSGRIEINGSSTIMPVVERITGEFEERNDGDANIQMAETGSVGGLRDFCAAGSQIDITGASRPMSSAEMNACDRQGFEYSPFLIGHDGITVVVAKGGPLHPGHLTIEELRRIFGRDGVSTWAEVRQGFPDEPIRTCMPDVDSGTHDWFQERVMGAGGPPSTLRRPEEGVHLHSSNDAELVQCANNREYAIAFFGRSYYVSNSANLDLIDITPEGGGVPVEPSHGNIAGRTYPLSRPLHIYVKDNSIRIKPQVATYLGFLLEEVEGAVNDAEYTPESDRVYEENLEYLESLRRRGAPADPTVD